MGYLSSSKGIQTEQPATAITAIYIGFSAIPACAALACILAMVGYNLKQADFERDKF